LVYLLGGLVIGLRLLFEGFGLGAVATAIGQLPRQLVLTTALLEVALPAAVVGLVAVMVTGFRPFWKVLDHLWRGIAWGLCKLGGLLGRWGPLATLGGWIATAFLWVAEKLEPLAAALALLAFAALLTAPAVAHAPSGWPTWGVGLSGLALTYTLAGLCLPRLRWVDPRRPAPSPIAHAALVFAIFGVLALFPAVLLASTLQFAEAQVCTTTSEEPIEGRLIGEGGGQVLLERIEAGEQWVVSLPAAQVMKSEYGDVAALHACQEETPEEKQAVLEREAQAEKEIGPHGGLKERRLATQVRPYLYFDTKERWRPLAVNAFVKEHGNELCVPGTQKGKPRCDRLHGISQLHPAASEPVWINIRGGALNPKDFASPDPECHKDKAVDCNGGKGAAIYYRRTGHDGLWYWDFWWFYRYNDYNGDINDCQAYCDDHEGDWEGMVVITTESLEPEVTGAIYAAHRDRIYVPAADLPTVEDHPRAYVAEGTHATYPYVCKEDCHQYSGLYTQHFPEEDHGGQINWDDNVDSACAEDDCVKALPRSNLKGELRLPHAASWAAWPGLWGASCAEGCKNLKVGFNKSPRSPGFQIRFKCPWVANLKAVPVGDEGLLTGQRRFGGWEREQAACIAERSHG
jgi:hypothetical protein